MTLFSLIKEKIKDTVESLCFSEAGTSIIDFLTFLIKNYLCFHTV